MDEGVRTSVEVSYGGLPLRVCCSASCTPGGAISLLSALKQHNQMTEHKTDCGLSDVEAAHGLMEASSRQHLFQIVYASPLLLY